MREGAIAAVPSVTVPVIWSVLGYSFPAGSMIVGLLACFMVRLFITLDALGPKRWILDGIVTGLAMLITAVWIVEHQVDLFAALGTGAARARSARAERDRRPRRSAARQTSGTARYDGDPTRPRQTAVTARTSRGGVARADRDLRRSRYGPITNLTWHRNR